MQRVTLQVGSIPRRHQPSAGAHSHACETVGHEPLLQDLLSGAGDGAYAIDAHGCVIGWNAAAERLTGRQPDEVLGRPCQEVLGCRDRLGCAVESSVCPLRQSLGSGLPPAPVDVLVQRRSGQTIAVSENAILLPDGGQYRALVLLRPSASGVVAVPPGRPLAAGPNRASGQRPVPQADLADTLDRLLIATGADAAELFLAMPGSGQMVLAMHRGAAPRAFREIVQFERGEGFPGLIAQRDEPLVSLDLPRDDRYRRNRVKFQGFQFYLGVPVWGESSFIGSLHIASRRHADAVVVQLPFVAHVAQELGIVVELERLRAAELIADPPLDPTVEADINLRRAAEQGLQALIAVAGMESGAILLTDESTGALRPISEFGLSSRLRRSLVRTCETTECPAMLQRRCILPRDTVRAERRPCDLVDREFSNVLCLPLEVTGMPVGVVLLGSGRREPLPARHLSFVHAAIDRAAVTIYNARVALRREQAVRQRIRQELASEIVASIAADTNTRRSSGPHLVRSGDGMPFLDLRCLGQFTIVADGQIVPPERFVRRRSLTLLKILLSRYKKQVHREELIELLWPGADPNSASSLLNVVVHYLRRALQSDSADRRASNCIRTSGDYYAFDAESPHRLDSQEFLQATQLGEQLETRCQPEQAIEACERAIALYAGDFLEEEIYSDWCALDREYFRDSFLTTLRRAAHLRLGQGNLDAAVLHYRRALLTDTTLEDVHRELMRILWTAGRRDEALRQYRDCRAVLERELGIAPLPETEALRWLIVQDGAP